MNMKLANMIPNIDDDLINRLVDQWQGSVIAYFKQRFKEYASKEDNSLDSSDFIKIFPQLASFPKNVKKKAFDFFDRDQSGRVDFKEFCQSLSVCCKSDPQSKIYLLFMLFDTDNDKYLSKNEMQTLIKLCHSYIFKITSLDIPSVIANNANKNNNNNASNKNNDQQGNQLIQQRQLSQLDRLSMTQGNILNEGQYNQDNIKILSKTISKEQNGQETSSNLTNQQDKKQQQQSSKEIQKKQQLLKAQEEKETINYLYGKKQDKINFQTFYDWAIEYFNIQEFFLMFELVPDPLFEREMIRSIIKEEGGKERSINELLLQQRQQQSVQQQNDDGKNKKNNKNNNSNNKLGGNNSNEKLLQKERFTETIYVVSWKWWFMWKYYINYAYKNNKLQILSKNNNNNLNHDENEQDLKGKKNINNSNANAVNYNNKTNATTNNNNNNKNDPTNNNNNNNQNGQQNKEIGGINIQNCDDGNNLSNIANHQFSNNNTFFNSKENLNCSPSTTKKMNELIPQNTPHRRDSNNSRNSMVDLEFNNSIPSERQEEQKVKYHLQPNAFKNNLEFNQRNYQDEISLNDIQLDQFNHSNNNNNNNDNYINNNQQNKIGGQNMNQYNHNQMGQNNNNNHGVYHNNNNNNTNGNNRNVFGGEEDVISDNNLFRPYSPSKVNHDASNYVQNQINSQKNAADKAQQQINNNYRQQQQQGLYKNNQNNNNTINNNYIRRDNSDDTDERGRFDEVQEQNYRLNDEDNVNGVVVGNGQQIQQTKVLNSNFHNQPQESQVRSVSQNHHFQQQNSSNFYTPRAAGQIQTDNSAVKQNQQFNFTNAATTDKNNNNNYNMNTQTNPRDINDSDLFQNPNWNTQQQNNYYELHSTSSPHRGIINNNNNQFNDISGKKTNLISPQQVEMKYDTIQQNTKQLLGQEQQQQQLQQDFQYLNLQNSGINSPQQQILQFIDTPSSNGGIQQIQQIFQQDGMSHTQHLVQDHIFMAEQNDIDAIHNNNSNNNRAHLIIGNHNNNNQQQQSSLKQSTGHNNYYQNYQDNLTIYNEVLHPETRGMNQSNAQFDNNYGNNNNNNDVGTIKQFISNKNANAGDTDRFENQQQYMNEFKQIYNDQQNQQQYTNIQQQNQNQNQKQQDNPLKQHNEYQPSTLFSQTKFNICKPLQGLKGETHDLLSQDDLSKSNINGNKNINFAQSSEFVKEQMKNEQLLLPSDLIKQDSNNIAMSKKDSVDIPQNKEEQFSFEKQQKNDSNNNNNNNQNGQEQINNGIQDNKINTNKSIDNDNNLINHQNNNSHNNNNNKNNNSNNNIDKLIHDDYMDEIDKGIQNTEEFDNHDEQEEDHKKANDDHIRFQQYGGHNLGDRPTQIDNTDLEGEYQGELQKNILRNHDYVIIPENAWKKLFGWYGGGPSFKRKRIVDIQKNYKTIELYPPLLIGHRLRKNGEINYDSRQELMVSSWKTLKEVSKKFSKYFKNEKVTEDIIYYKKMGSYWKKAENIEKTMLIDLQIESGTIFLFMTKSLEDKFIEKQQQKQINQGMSYVDILDQYEIGDRVCISHPSERIEKKGYIFQIKADMIQIHFKRESFRNDIVFEKKQLENYLKIENQQQQGSQVNIEQSIMNMNDHIKYNPKMIGLANLGNTCFINCIIQFLVHTPFFRQYLLDEIYLDSFKDSINNNNNNGNNTNSIGNSANLNTNPSNNLYNFNNNNTNSNNNNINQNNNNNNNFNNNPLSPIQNSNNNNNNNHNNLILTTNQNERSQTNIIDPQGLTTLIRELSQLTKSLKQKPYNDIYDPVRPSNLKKAIDITMPHFSGHEQHDAQEFLQGFLDKLNDEVKYKRIITITNKQEDNINLIQPVLSSNQSNNNMRTTAISNLPQLQSTSKTSFSGKQELLNNDKQQQQLQKTLGDEFNNINNNIPAQIFPPEPISNLPLQPAIPSQVQTDNVVESTNNNINQKRESGDNNNNNIVVENQKKQIIQEVQEFSIIKDVYMGQTINQIQCSACGNINFKYEDFYSISLPLPIKNEVLYEVTYLPRITKGIIRPIKKYGIKLHRSATFGEFQQAFQKTSKINTSSIVFAEIYKNNFYRNLYNMDPNIPMRNLGIRSNDEILAYDVISTNKELEDETMSLYPHNINNSSQSQKTSIKENDFVDFNINTNKWVHGMIERITQTEQKNDYIIYVRVLEENLKQSSHPYKIRFDSKKIHTFRSQIPLYPKEKGFVVFVANRRKMNNMMEKFGIPFCIVIPSWLTWKELHLLVYSQIKRCIDFNYLIKKYQAAKAQQSKSKVKSAKTQGYTKLNGEQEDNHDFNNAAQTYQNDQQRSKERSNQKNQYEYMRDHNRQKAPSFHGFIDDNMNNNQPLYEEDDYMRNRKSLFNYQQIAPIYSSKSPQKYNNNNNNHNYNKSQKEINYNGNQNQQQPPQLRPTLTDYQNLYKANTSTLINPQQPDHDEINGDNNNDHQNYQMNGPRQLKKNIDPSNNKKQQITVKQSVNLENKISNNNNDNYYNNPYSQFSQQSNSEQFFATTQGEIKNSIDFLQSNYVPYKLRVINQTTQRCGICDLSLLPDDNEQCQGCEHGLIDRPIFWDIKEITQLYVDWTDSLSFNPTSMVPQNDESYVDLKKQKNEIKMGIPIASCFNLFSAQDKVELECDKCKVNQIQSTKHLIYKLPNILIIHLSRFQYQNGLFEKIDDLVNYPLKKLDLSEWVFKENKNDLKKNEQSNNINDPSQNQQQQQQQQQRFSKSMQDSNNDQYDLFAVVNHLGNGHGGHYTSFVNIKEDGTELKDCWVNFDDESVNYINQEEVISNKGYLLIYKKKFSTSAIVNLTYKKL